MGAGPAGRAVAAAASDTGLQVALIDPNPRRVWPQTYAAWCDELPASVPQSALSEVMGRMRAFGTTMHEWPRAYAVIDNAVLWKHLWRDDVTEISGRVVSAEHGPTGSTVHLKDGRRIASAVVVDASGAARVLSGGRPPRTSAQQTAVGVVLEEHEAAGLCPPGTGLFMDWRAAPDTRGGWPTFLYGVRLGAEQVLLEETSLARRPALPLALLRRRLRSRLGEVGIEVPEGAVEERVRFPVDDPLPRPGRVIPFGASAGLVHPATGFSVATSLRKAPWIASAITAGLPAGPAAAARAAWSILWPPRALAAHALRRRALQALLTFPPHLVPEFFESFFALPPHHQSAFLSVDHDPAATAAAMTVLFRRAPGRSGGNWSPAACPSAVRTPTTAWAACR
ncbi:lycopene cyclase family protein [Saccharopolyspora spinosporotrichia]